MLYPVLLPNCYYFFNLFSFILFYQFGCLFDKHGRWERYYIQFNLPYTEL
eukprot:Gb_36018 [translate_table: standard]